MSGEENHRNNTEWGISKRRHYPSDLTDSEWEIIEPLIPARGDSPAIKHDIRDILDAIFYIMRTGCSWRMLPHDFPAWQSVYTYFRNWRVSGDWEKMHTTLRERARTKQGRDPTPSAAIIDSQSVKTTHVKGPRGYDAGKKINGRKRHIIVDTNGFILGLKVHTADIQDRDGGKLPLEEMKGKFPRLSLIWADNGYQGQFIDYVKKTFGYKVEIIKHEWERLTYAYVGEGQEAPPPRPKGFQVLKWRWIVERTFGWFERYRRLSKDYEGKIENSESTIYICMIKLMLGRLATKPI